MLSPDQAEALASVATSGRVVDVLVGPAGAGKTTALAALRRAWEAEHGDGSVVGFAPSATAAAVLSEDLGIATENTAKWLTNHDLHGTTFQPGQLVIVDEASLAGTFTLERITRLAADAGAKTLLVGDWAQLQSVDAGGAFHLLITDRHEAPELTDIHRFRADWEKVASLGLRHGRPDVLNSYEAHGRIIGGEQEDMTEQAYQAWRSDLAAGRATLLIAESHETVRDLNQRARHERIMAELVDPTHEAKLNDDSRCSRGDLVITRHNDRRLIAGNSGWVRNGDRWNVVAVHGDGAVTVRRAGHRSGASVILPADYVAEHLDLGYAVTAHRAQGVTVDTAHTVVTPTTTRENLYVAMTRGRDANVVYVATDRPDQSHTEPHPSDREDVTARDVLVGVLQNVGAEMSAHEATAVEAETWNNITQIAAEYETIVAAGQEDRWAALIRASGLTDEQAEAVLASDAFGPLAAELLRAEALSWNLEVEFPRVVSARSVEGSEDIAAVLHGRLGRVQDHLESQPRRGETHYIVGLIPRATGPMSPAFQRAAEEREAALEQRASDLLHQAVADRESWLSHLGSRPTNRIAARRWEYTACAVAAYRDRYGITARWPLGTRLETVTQRRDRARLQSILVVRTPAAEPGKKQEEPLAI